MIILVVDDSKAMRMIVRRSLRQAGMGDHTVQEASNGREALESIEQAAPDLILSDWNMPDMSGIELLDALRAQNIQIPFGFITSERSAEVRQRAAASGARFLVPKPFTARDLQVVLAAYAN